MTHAGEPLSPQAADLVRRIARVILDEPADLMAEVQAAVSAAAMSRCAPSRCWPRRWPRVPGRTCCTGPSAS